MTHNAASVHEQSAAHVFPHAIEPMLAVWKSSFANVPVTIASEVTKFASHRLRMQFDYLTRLQGCKTLADVLDVHADYLQTMASDYAEESGLRTALLAKAADFKKVA